MARKKITVVGAGNVGASIAAYASAQELGDVVLVDILEGIPQGKGLDLLEAAPILGADSRVVGSGDYEATRDSDLVVITAGIARKPGMSRDDLLSTNVKIVGEVAQKAAQFSPKAVMMIVSNPLDAMVYTAWKRSGFAPRTVIGMAGVLDTARFRAFLAEEIGVSVEDIHALVLGGHGDTMVPLTRYLLRRWDSRYELHFHGTARGNCAKNSSGRRGDRESAQDRKRLLCPCRVRCSNDAVGTARQETPIAGGSLPGRRIRRERDICRGPRNSRISRSGKSGGDRVDRRRTRGIWQIRRSSQIPDPGRRQALVTFWTGAVNRNFAESRVSRLSSIRASAEFRLIWFVPATCAPQQRNYIAPGGFEVCNHIPDLSIVDFCGRGVGQPC